MICHQDDGQAANQPDNAIPPLNRKSERLSGANSMGILSVCDHVQRFTLRTQFM